MYGALIGRNAARRAGGGIEDQSGSSTTAKLSGVSFENNSTGTNPGNGGAYHVTGDGNVDFSKGPRAPQRRQCRGRGLLEWLGAS